MKLDELNEYFEPSLYEMSNFHSHRTGLMPGTIMWVRTEPTGLPHTKYRVKFSHPQFGSAVFALWGEQGIQVDGNWEVKGKDLKRIIKLLNLISDHLRNHIDGIEDTVDLANMLTAVKPEIEKL